MVMYVVSFFPSIASFAFPLLAVADTGVYGYSFCGPWAGSGGRDGVGVQAAPTSRSSVTIAVSRVASRLGGQVSRIVVHFGANSSIFGASTPATLMRPPISGAQNQSPIG